MSTLYFRLKFDVKKIFYFKNILISVCVQTGSVRTVITKANKSFFTEKRNVASNLINKSVVLAVIYFLFKLIHKLTFLKWEQLIISFYQNHFSFSWHHYMFFSSSCHVKHTNHSNPGTKMYWKEIFYLLYMWLHLKTPTSDLINPSFIHILNISSSNVIIICCISV